jgi:hypothetical protein
MLQPITSIHGIRSKRGCLEVAWTMMTAAPGKRRLHSRLMFHVMPAVSVHIISKVPELARAIRDNCKVGGPVAAAMDSMTRSSVCKSSCKRSEMLRLCVG